MRGGSVSREGVQRDLLPLIEGTTVATKYGPMKTDHILFIASGAFHVAKPSDLLPELQGRLPIRVELKALTEEDFVRILSDTQASLTEQYRALLATEGVEVDFTEDGIRALARIAAEVNGQVENIGARRLQTVLEKLLEDVSFEAEERRGETVDGRRRLCRDPARRDRPQHRPQQIRALTLLALLGWRRFERGRRGCLRVAAIAGRSATGARASPSITRSAIASDCRRRDRRAGGELGAVPQREFRDHYRARRRPMRHRRMRGAISAPSAAPACSTPTRPSFPNMTDIQSATLDDPGALPLQIARADRRARSPG